MTVVTVLVAIVLAAPVTTAQSATQTIPKVDFANFTYPWIEPNGVPGEMRWLDPRERNKVTLVRGRQRLERDALLTLDTVKYGDLARNRGLDAAVVLTYHTGGTATWQYVYIYRLESGSPKLLAWFETGSRAHNGLYDIWMNSEHLVVELNDPSETMGLCCAAAYIRAPYKWVKDRFVQDGESKRLPNPDYER